MDKSNHSLKISFIGDIMCEKPLLKAAKSSSGEHDFSQVFVEIKSKLDESDYVIGNLETVCAGEKEVFTEHIYSFNSPDSLIEAIRDAGIDMVTTANNHCLDRGVGGLKRTLAVLNKFGIDHTGTYNQPNEKDRALVKEFNSLKIAFLAYTYGTNIQINNVILDESEKHCINLLQSQFAPISAEKSAGLKANLFKLLFKFITIEQWINIKRKIKFKSFRPAVDDNLEHISEEYTSKLEIDIEKAKSQADYVIVCLHSGGQFNEEPGQFSKHIMRLLFDNGVNLIVGTHPHVVQGYELYKDKKIGFYSLGSLNMSPSSPYVIAESLPDYSIMLHLYLRQIDKIVIEKITFTILKSLEDKNGQITVWPVLDLLQNLKTEKDRIKLINEVSAVYNRFTKSPKQLIDVIDEYTFFEGN